MKVPVSVGTLRASCVLVAPQGLLIARNTVIVRRLDGLIEKIPVENRDNAIVVRAN